MTIDGWLADNPQDHSKKDAGASRRSSTGTTGSGVTHKDRVSWETSRDSNDGKVGPCGNHEPQRENKQNDRGKSSSSNSNSTNSNSRKQ